MKKLAMGAVILAVILVSTCVVVADSRAQQVPFPLKTASAGELGTILTGPNGMTLYIFTIDAEGESACNGPCAKKWPPFRPGASDPPPKAPLSLITRGDGTKQYAYKGQPLYYWVHDKKPGDTTGHKVGAVWFVAKP